MQKNGANVRGKDEKRQSISGRRRDAAPEEMKREKRESSLARGGGRPKKRWGVGGAPPSDRQAEVPGHTSKEVVRP